MDLIIKQPETFAKLKDIEISEWVIASYDIDNIQVGALLFQTGYLTIKEKRYIGVSESYLLEMPNHEVREAFNLSILSKFSGAGQENAHRAYIEVYKALENGDLQKMIDVLKGLLASIPYHLHVKKEAYYHSIFYAVMSILGWFDMQVETVTAYGRIDGILELKGKVYIMEFKYHELKENTSDLDEQILFENVLDEAGDEPNERKRLCR